MRPYSAIATGCLLPALAGCVHGPPPAAAPAPAAPVTAPSPVLAPPVPAAEPEAPPPPPAAVTTGATGGPAAVGAPETAARSPPKPSARPRVPAAPTATGTVAAAASAPAAPAAAAPAAKPAAPALDLPALEQRLRDTRAIGLFTKLSLKNQVDDLLGEFRGYYAGRAQVTLGELRRSYELLLMKVVTLLQDGDPTLATAVSSSREAIWAMLSDRKSFSNL